MSQANPKVRAPQRQAISKRQRFEIFKRDGFECQYCGAHPPGVLLQVDHIIPVASGGGNGPDNLITACQPCNVGKGAVGLSQVPQSLKDKASEVAEREEQIRGYYDTIEARRKRLEQDTDRVAEIYERFNPGYELSEASLVTVRQFIEKLGVYEVMEAMEIACTTRKVRYAQEFRYFCGICWNKIRDAERG